MVNQLVLLLGPWIYDQNQNYIPEDGRSQHCKESWEEDRKEASSYLNPVALTLRAGKKTKKMPPKNRKIFENHRSKNQKD